MKNRLADLEEQAADLHQTILLLAGVSQKR